MDKVDDKKKERVVDGKRVERATLLLKTSRQTHKNKAKTVTKKQTTRCTRYGNVRRSGKEQIETNLGTPGTSSSLAVLERKLDPSIPNPDMRNGNMRIIFNVAAARSSVELM